MITCRHAEYPGNRYKAVLTHNIVADSLIMVIIARHEGREDSVSNEYPQAGGRARMLAFTIITRSAARVVASPPGTRDSAQHDDLTDLGS